MIIFLYTINIYDTKGNIYTFESPGGWNIIGNTPVKIFNATSFNKPNLINPGDEVLFYEISKKEYFKFYNE